jgi:hypothetical protein
MRRMRDAGVLLLKGLCGGSFVVAFALVGHVVEPKRFAGLFSAAPSVALASLSVTIVDKGAANARQQTIGMLVGAIALLVYTLVARGLVERFNALRGAALSCVAWLAVALAGYAVALR